MSAPKVLVIGEKFIDRYWLGSASRLSPEAPLPVVKIEDEPLQFMGGAANVAENLRVLGCQVRELYQPGHYPIKNRLVANGTQVARWDQYDSVDPIKFSNSTAINHLFEGIDGVVISDYNKGAITSELVAIVGDKTRDKKIFIDTKSSPSSYGILARQATFFPNVKEYAQFTAAYDAMPVKVLKMSEHGMTYQNRSTSIHQPALAKRVNNVSGAGDTAVAAYTYAILSGKEPKDALEFAARACAVVVGKPYTGTADHGEILSIT